MRARETVNGFLVGAIDEKCGLSYNKRMKKISLLLFLIVVCFLAALCLASCGGSTPVKLTLSRLPDKRTVVQGCDPDLTGGLVLVEYKNGDEEEISMTELTVRGFDSSVLGAQSAVLVYTVKDVSASLVVDLTVVAAKVKRLEVTEQNPRSNYFVGESFDKETLTVTAHYETGASEVVRAYTVTPSALSLDTTEITISFREGRVKLPVTVIEKKPVSLNVERTETAKTTYFVGEDFLSEGFSATVTYNDGKTQHFETEELEFLRPVSERVYASPQSEADNRVLVVAHTDYGNVSGETVLSVSDILPVELSASGELTFFEGEYFSFGAEGAITVAVVYNSGEGEVLTANEDLSPMRTSPSFTDRRAWRFGSAPTARSRRRSK